MQRQITQSLIAASVTRLASMITISQPSYGKNTSFYCSRKSGEFFTFMRTSDGKKYEVMKFVQSDFPQNRAEKHRNTLQSEVKLILEELKQTITEEVKSDEDEIIKHTADLVIKCLNYWNLYVFLWIINPLWTVFMIY